MVGGEGDPALDASHWAQYTTDALEQLLESLEAMEQQPASTIAATKDELERRRTSPPE